ncbi:hypothetical protein ElyMa_005198000 [Elysia marginata]|uniref:Uncharacterized protein n=1 Tax=Elysia marginata TaxID=1093978 RepID=A0AAV4JX82_9GAST|nr:hypothetical protein ElyMa_005198000 [Elysia marginata]
MEGSFLPAARPSRENLKNTVLHPRDRQTGATRGGAETNQAGLEPNASLIAHQAEDVYFRQLAGDRVHLPGRHVLTEIKERKKYIVRTVCVTPVLYCSGVAQISCGGDLTLNISWDVPAWHLRLI